MPKVKGGPKELNTLLERVWQDCIEGGGKDPQCSMEAWGAARNAGWRKNDQGHWVKKGETSVFEGLLMRKKPKKKKPKMRRWG